MQVILKPRFWIIWSWLLVGLSVLAAAVNIAKADWITVIMLMTSLSANVALIAFWKNRS